MVLVGTGTKGTRFLKTNWPITEGLIAGTTKLPKSPNLIPQTKSLVSAKDKVGMT